MITLIVVGFLAGVITSISPCVLPVLPVVLTAGATRHDETKRSWRPVWVVVGLVVSFCLSTLFGSLVLSALHLPQDLLRDAGIVVLCVIGLGLIWTRFGDLLERPFTRLPTRQVNPNGNGIVLGMGLGLLFVPCAGPVLATIAIVGSTHTVGFGALVLTAAFGIGAGVPLLILAVAGNAITRRTGVLREHARQFRVTGGVLMIAIAVAIAFNLTDGLQRDVPGYTTALQNLVENNPGAAGQLHKLTTGGSNPTGPGDTCQEDDPGLDNCGKAPELTGITGWLNSKPLTLAGLRGKVVLIDFWTYSCINCQRTLPHLEAWYRSYAKDGLEIIGVHTPEFAFEHVESNVASQAQALGVDYPIAIDNNDATWNAYSNQYWPAEYLIDSTGVIRHVAFGEGDYGTTEGLIRALLADAHPDVALPPDTNIPDRTPTEQQTAETYLGSDYAPLHASGTVPAANTTQAYALPSSVQPDTFAIGGTWTSGPQSLTAGQNATLKLNFSADDVYLVIGGSGTATTNVDGKATTIPITGVPKLYTLYSGANERALLTLTATPGVQVYDFTFG